MTTESEVREPEVKAEPAGRKMQKSIPEREELAFFFFFFNVETSLEALTFA